MNAETQIESGEEIDPNFRERILDEMELREYHKIVGNKLRRLLFILGILLVVIGAIFWVQTESIAELFVYGEFNKKRPDHIAALTDVRWVGSFFISISTVFFSYLYMVDFNPLRRMQKSVVEEGDALDKDDRFAILSLLRSIDMSLEKGKIESVLSESERAEIVIKISETVETQLNESLLEKIEEKYGLAIVGDKLSGHATDAMGNTTARLKSYAEDLKSKASINLAYGIVATIISIMLLMYLLFNATPPAESANVSIAFFYIARFFLVVLVQGVAIFFLNLYKETLKNILYISNEITNHESKCNSLALALKSGNNEAATSIMLLLANTERNFLVKKGESSVLNNSTNNENSALITESIVKDLVNKLQVNKP